ncbi:crossover junction endodeoxyribonuclease RuvC [Halobacteriovorax marinus]|uniref:Crossover junction endodeoxyribonuclease RuvC n=1 Tax=Halobacteriovorax marinus (strain ATCC BAA-682 / DSM 15412 / SJ) TaxID=862908 RepID=E1X115_HALMS|nr:crossover junction endodeoxyribonuclease RuvC [Halobacteriovorax marinus]ATH09347.1 crossover junction endodeoxyribonuclease RuvC [Halobacteriovorax marinus]CBW28085.1 putative crossover Holliday junction endodeoxyribonuclease RuvC [Halobacteriovorax marinus SJ]
MKILGIDPGSRKAGWALIEKEGRKTTYLASGVLKYDKIDNFLDRLGVIHQSICELIEEYRPDEVALESLIFVKNVNSLAKLAQARGAMLAAIIPSYQGSVFEYSPTLIKQSVSGYGHADKAAIEKTLGMIFGKIEFKTNDESDALAIALCHSLGNAALKGVTKKASRGRSLKSVFKDRI